MLKQAKQAISNTLGAGALDQSRLPKYLEVLFRADKIRFNEGSIDFWQPRNGRYTAMYNDAVICRCGKMVYLAVEAKDNRHHLDPGEKEWMIEEVKKLRILYLAFRIVNHEDCKYSIGDYWTDAHEKENWEGWDDEGSEDAPSRPRQERFYLATQEVRIQPGYVATTDRSP